MLIETLNQLEFKMEIKVIRQNNNGTEIQTIPRVLAGEAGSASIMDIYTGEMLL